MLNKIIGGECGQLSKRSVIWSLNYEKWSYILPKVFSFVHEENISYTIIFHICADLGYSSALKNSCARTWSCRTHIICIQNKTQVFIR